jgi:hypothetical protein
MSRWTPSKRRDFIRRLRALGFDGDDTSGLPRRIQTMRDWARVGRPARDAACLSGR